MKATEIITPEDAIEWFEGQRVPIEKQGSLDSAIYNFTINSMIDVAVLALEKQIPKKPVENRYPWAICPVCSGSVYLSNVQEHIQNRENTHCEHCGQKLDWSDT